MAQVRITGVPFDQIAPKIQKGLDLAFAKTLMDEQRDLVRANPKDTGRMASSWQIGFNNPPDADRGSGWAEAGEKRTEQWEYEGKITFGGNWFISNNVPYAQYVALNYQPSANQAQKDWYTSIANQTANRFADNFRKLKL